jgi:GTP-binding protein EngB required for normal cell division
MTEDKAIAQGREALLNEFQARRLRVTCEYIDKLLEKVQEILHAGGSKAAFPPFIADITPAQSRTVEDYIARLRAQLVRVLDGQGIVRERPSIPASRAIHVALGAIDIAVEELKPHYMRGYGAVPEAAVTELNGIVGELRGLVSKLDRYLAGGAGQDLKARLLRLEQSSNDLRLLSIIEQVVANRGLVEFRGPIASLLDRAEDSTFEIAVFGRVSSGKSSLLNAILEADVLPVGVTPITAVPTRIAFGEKPSMRVSFAEAPAKIMEISALAEFATEQRNPSNAIRVTRIVVLLPARRLRDGVAFMDTPGLGSLATSGAAETLAYLPKCDLGVVLVDAGATLTAEDLQTILRLHEAAIPVNVLLSKADLLVAEDREKVIHYVSQHIASECALELPVHPVSVLASHKELLDRWFAEHILPLYGRSQDLRDASLRRKIGGLRESVTAALQLDLQRSKTSLSGSKEQIREIEARLRRATGRIEQTRSAWERELELMAADSSEAFREMAARLMDEWSKVENSVPSIETLLQDSITQVVQAKVKRLHESLETLAVQVRDDLKKSAGELGIADVPTQDEFQSLIRGTPVFDGVPLHFSISRPVVAAWFGRQFAESRLANRLQRELGETLGKSLGTYFDVLKEWASLVTSQVLHRFEAYAEGYRAQAERALGGKNLTNEEVQSIRQSLKLLGAQRTGSEADGQRETNEEELPMVRHAQKGESQEFR